MMFVEGLREKARVGFDTWLQQETDSERICCVTGPLGSGKTTLAAEFCGVEPDGEGTRDVKKQKRESEEEDRLITAFYFFQGDENLALNKCWVKVGRQLADQLGYNVRGDVSTEGDSLFVFRRFVAEPLTRLSKPSNKIVILVDGVDKLPWEEQESFWEIVSQTWERETPTWVHLAVFSYTTLRLSGAIRWIDLQDEDHEKDIELLCNARLASFMQDEEDVQYATKHIVRHSTERQTVLLYTSCVLDALLEGRSHRSVTLDDIWEMEWQPECLVHAFRPYLIHFLDHVMDGDIDRYHQLLSCLSAARTPLSIDVAAEALEMNKESLKALASRSTSLVYQDGDVIKFAHPCLKDVVQHRRCGKHPDGSPLQVKARRGHEWFVHFLEHNRTSSLALHDLIYHLCCARKWDAVRDHLLDFDWVLALVSEEGCALKLIEDTDKLYNDKPHADVNATDVVRAIDLGLEAILADSALLKQQIIGRIPDKTHPIRRSYESSLFAQTERAKRVFLPVTNSLELARSNFRKRLRIDGDLINSKVQTDGRFVVFQNLHKASLYVWDTLTEILHQFREPDGEIKGVRGFRYWLTRTIYDSTKIVVEVHDWRFEKVLFSETVEEVLNVAFGDPFFAVNKDIPDAYDDEEDHEELLLFDLRTKTCLQRIVHAIFTDGMDTQGGIVVLSGFEWINDESLGNGVDDDNRRHVFKIWNVETGECLRCMEVYPSRKGMYISLSDDLLFVNCGKHNVWNWKTGLVERTLPIEADFVDLTRGLYFLHGEVREIHSESTICFLPSTTNEWMVSVNDNVISSLRCGYGVYRFGNVLSDVKSSKGKNGGRVYDVDEKVVLSVKGVCAHLWDTKTGDLLLTLNIKELEPRATSIKVALMGHGLVVCSTGATVAVWDKVGGMCRCVIKQPCETVSISSNTVTVASELYVKEYHASTGELMVDYGCLPCSLRSPTLLPGGFIIGDDATQWDESKFVISYKTGEIVQQFKGSFRIQGDLLFIFTFRVQELQTVCVRNWRTWDLVRSVDLVVNRPVIISGELGSLDNEGTLVILRRENGTPFFVTSLTTVEPWIFPVVMESSDLHVVAFDDYRFGNTHIFSRPREEHED